MAWSKIRKRQKGMSKIEIGWWCYKILCEIGYHFFGSTSKMYNRNLDKMYSRYNRNLYGQNMGELKTKKLVTAEQYIEFVSKDFQFNKKHEDYLGYINIDPRAMFDDHIEYAEVALQIAMNPDQFESIANKYGLTIESAHEGELIFAEL